MRFNFLLLSVLLLIGCKAKPTKNVQISCPAISKEAIIIHGAESIIGTDQAAQWEYAARAGSKSKFVWGDQRAPNGIEQANTWQGAFPIENKKTDGYRLRAPTGCYEPNDYGLYDMIGNVWEWTLTEYEYTQTPNSYTIKGGSFLCAPNYCARYRAPARQGQEADFSTNHIGFRTVSRN